MTIDFDAAKSVIDNSALSSSAKDGMKDYLDTEQNRLTRIEEMILNEKFSDAVKAMRDENGHARKLPDPEDV